MKLPRQHKCVVGYKVQTTAQLTTELLRTCVTDVAIHKNKWIHQRSGTVDHAPLSELLTDKGGSTRRVQSPTILFYEQKVFQTWKKFCIAVVIVSKFYCRFNSCGI